MSDLGTQIRDYIDATTTPVSVSAVTEEPVREPETVPSGWRPRSTRPSWTYALAASLAVFVVVGSAVLLAQVDPDVPPLNEPEQPAVTSPPAPSDSEPEDQQAAPLIPGISWTRVSDPDVFGGPDGLVNAVTATPGCITADPCGPMESLLAVGYDTEAGSGLDAAIWVSADGEAWEQIRSEELFGGEGVQVILDVAAVGNRVVAVGVAERSAGFIPAAVWVSEDGGWTWTRAPHDPEVFGSSGATRMLTVIGTDDGFLAAGDSFWRSSDGIGWEIVDDSMPINRPEFFEGDLANALLFGGPGDLASGTRIVLSLTRGGPGYVAVGEDDLSAAVWASSDGIDWTQIKDEAAGFTAEQLALGQVWMRDVVEGPDGLVAVGKATINKPAVWRSADGLAWERLNPDPNTREGNITGITRTGDRLVAVGTGVWISADAGATWTRLAYDANAFNTAGGLVEVAAFTDTSPTADLRLVGGGAYFAAAGVWIGTWDQ